MLHVYRGDEQGEEAEWPTSGPWSTLDGHRVPTLCGGDLPLRAWFGLVATAVKIGRFEVPGEMFVVKAETLQLAKWLFNLQDAGGDDYGAAGWFPFRRHASLDDLAKHYCATYGYANVRTFWRHFKAFTVLGLVRQVAWPTNTHETSIYEMCLHGDSPLISRLPVSLAEAVRVHELARLLGERDLPDYTVAGGSLADVAAGYVPTVALAEGDEESAAHLKKISDLEIAMMHAPTAAAEEMILGQAETLDRGWAYQDATPAPVPQARPDAPLLLPPGKTKPRRIPGSLKASLAGMRLVKRTVFGFSAPSCHTTPISHDWCYPSGSVISSYLEPADTKRHGRSKAKAAPTARNINGAAGTNGAWRAAGMPIPGLHGAGRAQARWAGESPTQDEREVALKALQQVYAMWKRKRPRQTLIGTWVEGSDGIAVFEPGEGYADLHALIGMALARTTRTDLLDMAAKCCGEKVENPVRCLAKRLWKLVEIWPRHGELPAWELIPADYVLAQDELGVPAAVAGQLQKDFEAARKLASPGRVAAPDTRAVGDLKAVRDKALVDGAAHRAAGDAAENKMPEKAQTRREHLKDRDAALANDELWRRRRAANQAAAEQRAEQERIENEKWERRFAEAGIHTGAAPGDLAPQAPGRRDLAARIAALQARFPLEEGGAG